MKTLPSGTTYSYGSGGERICTGSSMGHRSSHVRSDEKVKCYLRRLRWVDGDYDEQGAYWGYVDGTHIYWCNFDLGDTNEDIFVRATSRDDAKQQVREQLPNAVFFN